MPTILFKRFRHDVWHHQSFFCHMPCHSNWRESPSKPLGVLHCMSGMLLTSTPQVPTDRLVVLFPNGPRTHRMGGKGAWLHGYVIGREFVEVCACLFFFHVFPDRHSGPSHAFVAKPRATQRIRKIDAPNTRVVLKCSFVFFGLQGISMTSPLQCLKHGPCEGDHLHSPAPSSARKVGQPSSDRVYM